MCNGARECHNKTMRHSDCIVHGNDAFHYLKLRFWPKWLTGFHGAIDLSDVALRVSGCILFSLAESA